VAVGGAALSEGTGWALRVRHAAFAAGHDAPLIGERAATRGRVAKEGDPAPITLFRAPVS
jgi:hypothetical protein